MRVEALNHALRGIPREKIRYHTCYGINMGPRVHDMEAKDIIDIVLKINAGAFSFEASNPRHEHEWTVWNEAKIPDGAVLIPGVISHSTILVEHPELIAQRIARYAKIVGRQNVIAGIGLRICHLRGLGRGAREHRVGEIRRARQGRADRVAAALGEAIRQTARQSGREARKGAGQKARQGAQDRGPDRAQGRETALSPRQDDFRAPLHLCKSCRAAPCNQIDVLRGNVWPIGAPDTSPTRPMFMIFAARRRRRS